MNQTENIDLKDKQIRNPNDLGKISSPGQLVIKRFLRNKLAIFGIVVIIVLFIFSFIGPLFTGYDYDQVFINDLDSTYRVNEAPSFDHWLGLDANGMDILTRLMYGGRISLTIGFVVVLIELIIGIILGGVAGFYGGVIDGTIMRIVDIFNCIPYLPIMLIVGSIASSMDIAREANIYILMLVMGLLGWPAIARLVRGQILSLREMEYMIATNALGLRTSRRIFKHLIPNVIPQLIVITTGSLGGIILTEASLSFLGFGVRYPVPSWGNMINAANDSYRLANYWFTWIPAGVLILVTVLSFNFVGDGLRDAYDPKMKR